MTALAHETTPDPDRTPNLDEVLWQAWKDMELPEGYRAEIVEGLGVEEHLCQIVR